MSRVGKNPITIPDGVEIKVSKTKVSVTGPKGSLEREMTPGIEVEVKDGEISVTRPNNSKYFRSLHGLYRSLIHNMVEAENSMVDTLKKLETVLSKVYKKEIQSAQ